MLENVYEGLNARPKVYLSKEYFCKMYPTCVSSKLCEIQAVLQENYYEILDRAGFCNLILSKAESTL